MNIAFVAPEFFPFVDVTGKGRQTACLVDEIVSLGHDVCVVLPFPEGENLDAYSLARRLVPITVEVDGKPIKSIRYDGRSPSGVSVHLLGFEQFVEESKKGSWPAGRVEAFGKAAAALLGSMNEPVDTCISCGVEASCVPAVLTNDKDKGDRPHHVLVLHDSNSPVDEVERGIKSADRVIFADGGVLYGLEKKGVKGLAKMIESGEAVTLERPVAIENKQDRGDKLSQKTEFQLKQGLPVRADVPLVCFPNFTESIYAEAMESLLKRDVQVVAPKNKLDVSILADRYGDRLALVSEEEILAIALDASDVCVVGEDGALAAKAMSRGTLPLAGPALSQDLVELEPSCKTGSGILLNAVSAEDFEDAFGRLLAAFVARTDFYGLLNRLPSFAPNWKTTANYYLQVVESIELR